MVAGFIEGFRIVAGAMLLPSDLDAFWVERINDRRKIDREFSRHGIPSPESQERSRKTHCQIFHADESSRAISDRPQRRARQGLTDGAEDVDAYGIICCNQLQEQFSGWSTGVSVDAQKFSGQRSGKIRKGSNHEIEVARLAILMRQRKASGDCVASQPGFFKPRERSLERS